MKVGWEWIWLLVGGRGKDESGDGNWSEGGDNPLSHSLKIVVFYFSFYLLQIKKWTWY